MQDEKKMQDDYEQALFDYGSKAAPLPHEKVIAANGFREGYKFAKAQALANGTAGVEDDVTPKARCPKCGAAFYSMAQEGAHCCQYSGTLAPETKE